MAKSKIKFDNKTLLTFTRTKPPIRFLHEGKQVHYVYIEGSVTRSWKYSKGTLYHINDGTAEVRVYYKHNLREMKAYKECYAEISEHSDRADLSMFTSEQQSGINRLLLKIEGEMKTFDDGFISNFIIGARVSATGKLTMMFDEFTLNAFCMKIVT